MTKYPFQNLTPAITNVVQYMGYTDLTEDDIASASSVDIYFPQLEILNVETTEVMSIFTYIANVGGNLGNTFHLHRQIVTFNALLYR